MPTEARQAEAERVHLVYYWALGQLANQTVAGALELWQEVPASTQAAKSAGWLRNVLALVKVYRRQARDLAMAYYRLERALLTGSTVRDPDLSEGGSTRLSNLRDEFEAEVDRIDPQAASPAPRGSEPTKSPPASPEAASEPDYEPDDYDSDDDDILLEEIRELEAELERQEREADEQASHVIDQLGVENLLNKLEKLEAEETAQQADQDRANVHDLAGKRQAAAAARITQNAARGLAYSLAEYDSRAIGWVRYSTTGSPCGFCAMLISRGVVYKTKASAGSSKDEHGEWVKDQDRYHDNCRCVAVPVFLDEQYDGPLFEQNRYYQQLWNERIRGKYSGDRALSEWRKLLRAMQADSKDPATQAVA